MSTRSRWSRSLVVVGGIGMFIGAIDPLEGSVLVLVGSALVLLGMFLGQEPRQVLLYWSAAFGLIVLGVAAMFALSALGGIGGTSGQSMWLGVLILPYPVGWIMGVVNLLSRLTRGVRHRHAVT